MKKHKINFYGIMAILILVFTLLFILFFSPGVSSTADLDAIPTDIPDDTLSSPESTVTPENPDYSKLNITPSNVQAVISAMARPGEYYQETVSTLYHSSGSRTYPRKKWVHGALQRVDVISETNTVLMHILYHNKDVYMWRAGSARYYKTSMGEFSPDNDQMIMTYEEIANLAPESITKAEYTVYNSIPCIYVESKSSENGYTSKYWIATDTGLLAFGQTLDRSGNVFYTVESKQIAVTQQDDSLFLLPNGSSVAQ